jgi:hypothetical protein
MKKYYTILVFITILVLSILAKGQNIPLGGTILVSTSPLKENVDSEAFSSFMSHELLPAWNAGSQVSAMYLTQADRGDRNGEYLIVCVVDKQQNRKKLPKGSPFGDKAIAAVAGELTQQLSTFLENPDAYTEYQLIGADQYGALPSIDLLGIHDIQVKPELADDFEKFVKEKLHPTVGHLVHDMNLLYYEAVDGQNKGSFITLFAIESVAARERFWPTGGTEQDIVKQLFGPYKNLARELGTFLVEDSYLKPESGGAAAYFESLEWTDFVVIDFE